MQCARHKLWGCCSMPGVHWVTPRPQTATRSCAIGNWCLNSSHHSTLRSSVAWRKAVIRSGSPLCRPACCAVQWSPTIPGVYSSSLVDGKVAISNVLDCTGTGGDVINADFTHGQGRSSSSSSNCMGSLQCGAGWAAISGSDNGLFFAAAAGALLPGCLLLAHCRISCPHVCEWAFGPCSAAVTVAGVSRCCMCCYR